MKIDKEKVIGYVRAYALMTKDKVIATWKSGRNGKFACIVGAILILLGLKSCLIDGGDSYEDLIGSEYKFSASDFKTKSGGDELFYVEDGKDDGYKEVVPNLRRIPEILERAQSITAGYQPQSNPTVGNVYFTDPDAYASSSTITHVGDGWVIARTDCKNMYGDYMGYIYTPETYIEGQKLRAGYYVLVGTRKVPLVNGSSRTMFAFVRINSESNKLALESKSHNDEARFAAKIENERRIQFRMHRDEFMKNVERFKIVNFEDQIHLPTELKGMKKCFRLLNEDELVWYKYGSVFSRKISFAKLKQCMDNKDFDLYCNLFSDKPKIFCPPYLEESRYMSQCKRSFDIKGANDWKSKYNFYVVKPGDVHAFHWENPPHELSLDECLCVVDKENKEASSILGKDYPTKVEIEKVFGKIFSAGFWTNN